MNEWIKLLLTFNSLVTPPIIFKTKSYLVPVNTAFHNQSSLALQLSSHLGETGTLCSSRGQLTDSPEHPFFPPSLSDLDTLFQAILRFPSSSCWVDEVLGSWKCSRTEGSLLSVFLWCPLLSSSQSFHTEV